VNVFFYGPSNAGVNPGVNKLIPVAGDWTGKGFDTVGYMQAFLPTGGLATWTLANTAVATTSNQIVLGFGPVNGPNSGVSHGVIVTDPLAGRWVTGNNNTFGLGNVTPLQSSGGVTDLGTQGWHLKNPASNGSGGFVTVGGPTADLNFDYGASIVAGQPQFIVGTPPAGADPTALTQDQLDAAVAQAIGLYEQAGISSDELNQLESANFVITNLSDNLGGLTVGKTIYIDQTGAGFGWFIGAAGADPSSDQVDLLTVVLHELGHEIGMSDLDPSLAGNDLMSASLAPGVQRIDGRVHRREARVGGLGVPEEDIGVEEDQRWASSRSR